MKLVSRWFVMFPSTGWLIGIQHGSVLIGLDRDVLRLWVGTLWRLWRDRLIDSQTLCSLGWDRVRSLKLSSRWHAFACVEYHKRLAINYWTEDPAVD